MPRSGTSLVEQILASHPQVGGVGERKEIALMTKSLPEWIASSEPYPRCVERIDMDIANRLADQYLQTMETVSGGATRVADKMMTNYLHLGLIAILFPQARLVHCRRDPLDVCLSCYFQNFSHRPAHTFDLGDLGFYYRQYARLMDHWRDNLPLDLFEINYEQLVEDQEPQTRRLLNHCDLPWDPQCLEFHRTTRVVQTASSWQVRQPLNNRSVRRWVHYDRYLQPLRDALGDAVGK
jgi:hypothetical protein